MNRGLQRSRVDGMPGKSLKLASTMMRKDGCGDTVLVGLGRRRSRTGSIGFTIVIFLSLLCSADGSLFKRRAKSSMPGTADGKDKMKESVAWLMEDDRGDGGWKRVSDDGRVRVWKREVPGSAFVAIKSSAILEATQQAIFEVLTPGDIDIVRQYNPMVEGGRDIEIWDRDNKVSWSATMGIWPCRARDFVTHIRRAKLEDGSVVIMNSATTHPEAPETPRYVRGEILRGVFVIKPAGNLAHSEFTMVHHFNPGGNLPAWLVNWLAEGKPSTFVRKLEMVAKKWDREASRVKHLPCKNRGFADRPCAFLLAKKDGVDTEDASPAGPSYGRENLRQWLHAAVRMLAATSITAVFGCFSWSFLMRNKRSIGEVVGAARKGTPILMRNKPTGTNGSTVETKVSTIHQSMHIECNNVSQLVSNGH